MVEIGHVEAAGVVAHSRQDEPQREIKSTGSAAHPVRVKHPTIYESSVPVKEFTEGEFACHRLAVEEREEEIGREPLYVIEPISLDVECPSEPVGGIDQTVEDIAFRLAVYRRKLAPKGKVVAGETGRR